LKRTIFLALLCTALALMLTGCASSADTQPSPSPVLNTPGASPMISPNVPQATDNGLLGDLGNAVGDALTGENNPALSTAEEALSASRELRDAVQKLTEVDTAAAVAAGNTALVGITFNNSYQGGVDDRIRGMILDRAKAVNPGITAVAVTDDSQMIREITGLYEMLQSESPYATVKANADTLAERLDLYRD